MADDDEASLDRAREARKNLGMWSFTFTMRSPETVTDHEKAAIRRFRAAQAAKGCGVDAFLDKLNFRKFLDVVDAWNVRRLVVHLVKVEAGAVALGRRHRGHRMCPVQVVAKLLENRHQR